MEKVLRLLENPGAYPTAYEAFTPVLEDAGDDQAGIAIVASAPNAFADAGYLSLRAAAEGMVEKTVVYRVSNASALDLRGYEERAAAARERGFTRYEVEKVGDILTIRMTGDAVKVLNEAV